MNIEQQISDAAKQIATDRYSMSVGELMSLYKDGERDIHPDFQRFFRWSDFQKSRLVESLLLGLPIPPIFVLQKSDSKWELIDGLQRVSTLLELFGELKDRSGTLKPPLVLTKTSYLPMLQGLVWDATKIPGHAEVPPEVKLLIRRARVDVNIVLASKSHQDGKFELFDRLNSGGTVATEQEVRNCLLLMAGNGFFEWVSGLAQYQGFKNVVPLTDRQLQEQYDLEMVIRFIVLTSVEPGEARKIDDLHRYLTEKSLEFARDTAFDRGRVEQAFYSTFDLLNGSIGENAFRKYKPDENRHVGPFLLAVYEVVALGIGAIALATGNAISPQSFVAAYQSLWDTHAAQTTSVGKRASTRLGETLTLGRDLFAA